MVRSQPVLEQIIKINEKYIQLQTILNGEILLLLNQLHFKLLDRAYYIM